MNIEITLLSKKVSTIYRCQICGNEWYSKDDWGFLTCPVKKRDRQKVVSQIDLGEKRKPGVPEFSGRDHFNI